LYIKALQMTTRSGAIYNQVHTSLMPEPKLNLKKVLFAADTYFGGEDEEIQQYTEIMFRSIAPKPEYEVNIDFDEASKAWRANKRRFGESWTYIKPKATRSCKR
jgi:hypothetical protein